MSAFMSALENLLGEIRRRPDCHLELPCGLPAIPGNVMLPGDLKEFYELAGGATLGCGRVCPGPVRILGPTELVRIDQAVLGEHVSTGPFSWWYALADVVDGNYISIDLSPEHQGSCLDSFHETFAEPGYVNVVASSFSDFLQRLLNHDDDSSYWLQDGFAPLGKAFRLRGYEPLT